MTVDSNDVRFDDEYLGEACLKCKLHEGCQTPKMNGSGSEQPVFLIVGEAPGRNEDEGGEPFVGRSGDLLRDMLAVMDIDEHQVRFTNAIRCRPPDNKKPTVRQINYCQEFLYQEIQTYKPDVVMLLGNVPLKSVLGESGITNWNGVAVERNGTTIIPAFHPSFLLRQGVPDSLLDDWAVAFEKAADFNQSSGNYADNYNQHYPSTKKELRAMLEAIMAYDAGNVSYDTETKYLQPERPDNKVLSVAFATGTDAWTFPLYHKDSYITGRTRLYALKVIEYILTKKPITGHNMSFDSKITRVLLDIDFEPAGDTLVMSQLINPYKGFHSLKRLAGVNLNMFDYDRELQDYIAEHPEADYRKGGNYDSVPLDILLPYGNLDVIAVKGLEEVLWPQLSTAQQHIYNEFAVDAVYGFGMMEEYGLRVDRKLAGLYMKIYEKRIQTLLNIILQDADVQTYTANRTQELLDNWSGRGRQPSFTFNPNSTQQMAIVLYEIKGLPVDKKYLTDKGNPSVKEDAVEKLKGLDPIIEPYMEFKWLKSAVSKNLRKPYEMEEEYADLGDGCVHSTYQFGAKSGRTSSSNPPLQNIPTKEKRPDTILEEYPIKNIFVNTWIRKQVNGTCYGMYKRKPSVIVPIDEWSEYTITGRFANKYNHRIEPQWIPLNPKVDDGSEGCYLQADYSGMELRMYGSLANEEGFRDAFLKGVDVHTYVTSILFNMAYEDVTKNIRYKGKWCNWTMLYRGTAWTLANTYSIPLEEAEEVVAIYMDKFRKIIQYQERTISFAREHGYVLSPLGRQLPLTYINDFQPRNKSRRLEDERTAVNMPAQGTASDILVMAFNIMVRWLRDERLHTRIVNTVHDSILFDIFPGELTYVAKKTKDVMENIHTKYAPIWFPNIPFDWLTIPLKTDLEYGYRYGSLKELSLAT